MYPLQARGAPYFVTASSTVTTTATISGVANRTYYICDLSGSSDKSGSRIVVTDGSTVIWQNIINVASAISFTQPLRITTGSTFTAVVDGTAAGNVNIGGFFI